MPHLMRFSCVIFIGFVIASVSSFRIPRGEGDFVFGFHHNGGKVFWGPDTNKIPESLEPEIKAANLSVLIGWIEMADSLKENFNKMKERASSQCNGMCEIGMQDYEEEQQSPQNLLQNPPPELIPKIEDAIERMNVYEKRLLEELRKPEKDWNYSAESSTSVS